MTRAEMGKWLDAHRLEIGRMLMEGGWSYGVTAYMSDYTMTSDLKERDKDDASIILPGNMDSYIVAVRRHAR